MSVPTAAQIATLRSKPHTTKLYLSVYEPSTVLACRLNNVSATKGDRSITFDGTSAGSYLLVQSGMTMYVGTSAGAFDKGVIRVKSASSTVITVAENSHINWANDDYLTVVNFYEINAVYPRIIPDPANEENTLWYKDYDIAYTNQNTILGSFINMGSHYAGFVGENVFYSASGTLSLKNEALSYNWFFEGATVTGSTSHTPGNIVYNTPGHYTTRLIVSGTSGADVSYRHISIYHRPASGTSTPILRWELEDLSGGRDQAGYTGKIRIHETISSSRLKEGSLVVIFSEDWYGSDQITKQSFGGNSLGRSSIVFVGYVLQGSIKYNYRDSSMEFEVGSPTEIMKQAEGFGVSVQHNNDPSTVNDPNIPSKWITILDMDIRRAIYHYLRWHSTALLTNDFHFVGTDRAIQYFDADRTSLYDAINTLMEGALVGSIVCDRQGAIWAERSIIAEDTAFATNMEITKRDWMNDITIEERRMDKTAFLELGGIAFSGATGTYEPLLSNAPGVAPGYRGSIERVQGLALVSQAELNTLAGNLFAFKNSEYPVTTVNLNGNYRIFDIAPQEKIPLSISATDSVRGVSFSSKNFFINRLQWYYNSKTELFRPTVTLAELTTGFAGDTVSIPPTPNVESGGFNIPTITIPQIIIPALPVLNITIGGGGSSPLFVPAIGGNFYGEATIDDLVYNGGPFLHSYLSPSGQGISFNSGFSYAYNHEYNEAGGIFVVPSASFTVKALFYMFKPAGLDGLGTMTFSGGFDGLSSTNLARGSAEYTGQTLTHAANSGFKFKSITLTVAESFTVGDVCRAWINCFSSSLNAYVYFYGWLLEW